MAKASSKKIASQNASTLQILLYGFISSNFIHLLFTFILWKSSLNTGKVLLYLTTESVAISLAWVLKGMASKGDDLSQSGLTAYMFDIIYVTWFVHILTGLLSTYFWWLYLVIPLYAISLLYSKLILPYVFKNQSPFDSLKRIISGSARNGEDPLNFSGNASNAGGGTEGMSKRQAKLQKRMEKGDGRVQKRTTTR